MRCTVCKGRLLCGRERCPLIEKYRFLKSVKVEDFVDDPSPPSIFVGRIGYPRVYVGPLVALGVDPIYADSPWMWKSIEEAIRLRVSLLRTSKRVDVRAASDPDRFVADLQELAAAMKPLDIEAEILKLRCRAVFDDVVQPVGYNAIVKDVRLAENPKIPRGVEKFYYDDVKASDTLFELYTHGLSTYYLQKIFSAGILGRAENRKFVPTRWSITAVHSILGEELKREIADYEQINEYLVYSYEHFGNHFEVILSPRTYHFQLLEMWRRRSLWSPDRDWVEADSEDIRPKIKYSPLGGGYYAARFAVLEHLWKIRRQASVIVLREIKPSYYAPLGVWVVEEGVRRALASKPEKFDSFSDALASASSRISLDRRVWIGKVQRRITLEDFFQL